MWDSEVSHQVSTYLQVAKSFATMSCRARLVAQIASNNEKSEDVSIYSDRGKKQLEDKLNYLTQ